MIPTMIFILANSLSAVPSEFLDPEDEIAVRVGDCFEDLYSRWPTSAREEIFSEQFSEARRTLPGSPNERVFGLARYIAADIRYHADIGREINETRANSAIWFLGQLVKDADIDSLMQELIQEYHSDDERYLSLLDRIVRMLKTLDEGSHRERFVTLCRSIDQDRILPLASRMFEQDPMGALRFFAAVNSTSDYEEDESLVLSRSIWDLALKRSTTSQSNYSSGELDEVSKGLRQLSNNPQWAYRMFVIELMTKYPRIRLDSIALQLLNDSSPIVRAKAESTLGLRKPQAN